jgi:hypothetical protein
MREVVSRVIFDSGNAATDEARANDLKAQIDARIVNGTARGFAGTPSTSYVVIEDANDNVMATSYVDVFGILRQLGEGVSVPTANPPEWVQPTGAQDAYPPTRLDGEPTRVTFEGAVWENTSGIVNSFAPGVFGWTQV